MLLISMLAATVAFAQAAPAPAPATTPADQVATASSERAALEERDERDPDRVVCRREHVVGSNRPQRVCRTVRQMEIDRDLSEQALREGRSVEQQSGGPSIG